MFSSTHKLQRQALQPRTTSLGIFFRRRMPVNSTRACGNARFTCSMHSLYWAFSVVAATSVFMSFPPVCITTVRAFSVCTPSSVERKSALTALILPSKWACRFRIVSRPILDFQAHFDGKIKAVSADFRSKLEGVQTENAQ